MPETVSFALDAELPGPSPGAVHERLLSWFEANGRDLPWRRTRDAYAILVAEMMLQQTGVERVRPKYVTWMACFPTLQVLADAPRADVIRCWSGLGYNSRAVRLQEIARQAMERHGGRLPSGFDDLMTLKGIGRYTAGAVACFAHGLDVAFVDTNVRRVLCRVFLGAEGDLLAATDKRLQQLADRVLPSGRSWAWHQALMDLGALICTDARPACMFCPLNDVCGAAFRAGRLVREAGANYKARRVEAPWAGSSRYYRGRIVSTLARLPRGERLSMDALRAQVVAPTDGSAGDRGEVTDTWLRDIVFRLAADGLAAVHDLPGGIEVGLPE